MNNRCLNNSFQYCHWTSSSVMCLHSALRNHPPWNCLLSLYILRNCVISANFNSSLFILFTSCSAFYYDSLGTLIVQPENLNTARNLWRSSKQGWISPDSLLEYRCWVSYNYFLKQFHLCISLRGLPDQRSFYWEFWDSSQLTLKLCQSSGAVISWSSFIWNWFPLIPIWHFFI